MEAGGLNRVLFLGFFGNLVAFITITCIAPYYESDCGIGAVTAIWLPRFKYCADDIVRLGFPSRVLEEGGFAFHSIFDSGALMADYLVALSASSGVGWLAQSQKIE